MKLPKDLQKKKNMEDIGLNVDCPVCNVKISWKAIKPPNTYKGNCPNCGMGFSYLNGNIVSDPKFSK